MTGPRLRYWQAHAEELDEQEARFVEVVGDHDCHVTWVFDDEGDEPDFAYSTGLYDTFGHPEFLAIGLGRDLMHSMINGARDEIREGATFAHGTYQPGFLEGFDCLMCAVEKDHYPDYVGWSRWYYGGDDFPILQIVWPTTKGVWPWLPDYPDDLRTVQPVLGSVSSIQ